MSNLFRCVLFSLSFLIVSLIQWAIYEYTTVDVLELEYLLYVGWLFFSFRYRGFSICSIYGLFLVMYQVFLGGMILLNAIGVGPSFAETNFFTGYTFADDVQKKMILITSIALACVDVGLLIGMLIWGWKMPQWKHDEKLEKFAFRGVCITFLLALIGDYQYVNTLSEAGGYAALYLDKVEKPLLSMMDTIFFLFSYMYMMSVPSADNRKIFIFMYIICCLGKALCGGRGDGMAGLLLLVWWINLFIHHISLKKLTLLAVVLIMFALCAGAWRSAMTWEAFSFQLVIDGQNSPLLKFIINQAGSVSIIGYVINYEDEINNIGLQAILYPLTEYWGSFFASADNDLIDKADSSLGAYISYLTNPGFYFSGMGLGTCFPAELFAVGNIPLVIIGSLLIGLIVVLCVNKLNSNWCVVIIFMKFFVSLLLMPRNPYFAFLPIIPHLLRNIIIMYCIYWLYRRVDIFNISKIRRELGNG